MLAWGGPVAQIAMIRHELVDEERWITSARFNRVLALFQILPGPEAHELCVYFGMKAGGRTGAILAGLGFMLPGFLLMFLLSWMYVHIGPGSALLWAVFAGLQPAAAALILRAVHRIGGHALIDHWLWVIAVVTAVMFWVGVHFLIVLPLAGLAYVVAKGRGPLSSGAAAGVFMVAVPAAVYAGTEISGMVPEISLFWSGLRSGLLTFGGAYTVIPFLQHDAVITGGWMTDAQFLDGVALSSILPAPLIIVATFVGFVGGGPAGALAITAGIFLPSFAFTLLGHDLLERLVDNIRIHAFLDGVTAGVVGLIAVAALGFVQAGVVDAFSGAIFAVALVVFFRWKWKGAVAVVMSSVAVLGAMSMLW